MAKWGEGDPRWIVEERADAKNVNNWHWSEKNASSWSVDTIKKLLTDITLQDDEHSVKIKSVTKCEGEALVSIRKGKLICFYEWHIEADWVGQFKTGDNKTKYNGTVEILKLSDEYTIDDLDTNVGCSSSSSNGDQMKSFVKKSILEPVKQKLSQYLKSLKDEYGRDLILPTKNDANSKAQIGVPINIADAKRSTSNTGSCLNQQKDYTSKDISLTDEFFCTPEDLFKVLTTTELVQAFTRGPATVDAKEGGAYSVFGGNICGTFQSLAPGKLIEMQWRKRDWPSEYNSFLKLELNSFEGGTRLVLNQTNVPTYDAENTTNGWRTIFFAAIKQTFGYGGRMF